MWSSVKEVIDGDYKSQKLPLFIKQAQESELLTWKGLRVWLEMVMPMIMLSVLMLVSVHNTKLDKSLPNIILVVLINCYFYMILGLQFASSFLKFQSGDRNTVGKWPLALWILNQNVVSTN